MVNVGYEIIKMIATTKPGAQERGIAIAKAVSERTPCQWVTWRYVKDGRYDFFSGNYYDVERMAYHDFYRRLMEEYED